MDERHNQQHPEVEPADLANFPDLDRADSRVEQADAERIDREDD